MKQAIISAVVGVSKWLHGEGGKHFRTYTYPRIKRFTRQFVNLGIYELIERGYKIVDDTFYKGDIEAEAPEQIAMQRRAEEADGSIEVPSVQLPRFEDIQDDLYIWKGLEQGKTYRCGTFTMNNMLRTAMLKKGLKPDLEVTAIDPLYIFTKAGPGETGTVMDNAFSWLAKNGFPIPSWTPRMTDHTKQLKDLEASKTIDNAKMFTSAIRPTGVVHMTYKYDEAVQLDQILPANYEMQVSISFNRSLQYFGQKVPFLKKFNGKFDLARSGGHSIHGVRGSFSTWEDGEPGFAIIESAYRSSEDGFRFLKKKLMDYGLITIRFVELQVTDTVIAVDNSSPGTGNTFPYARLSSLDIRFGEDNKNVTLLQQYLMSQGIAIPAGATGFFGEQTRVALKMWQDRHFGDLYNGAMWGQISRDKFIQLHNLG